jgi:N-methylhydantoinase B
MPPTASKIDAIQVEIIRNAFIAIADDMNATLIRSAFTPIIYEMGDCSVALLDAEHRVLGQSAGLPIFLGNLETCTRATEEQFGADVWAEGDVWLLNDSFVSGTHLNDVTVFAPIFYEDELVGFATSRAHWLEIGAKDPSTPVDATEIYQEGLRLGPTRVVHAGEVVAPILDILALNSRLPKSTLGDLNAQIAVARTGERRLKALLDRFGKSTVLEAREAIFSQSEARSRESVDAIPDGRYTAEGYLDNDGLSDEPLLVRVTVEVAGDEMTVDLTESTDVARGPINCGEAQAISACRVAYKILVNPLDPVTGGTFRPLHVRVRRGSLMGAEEPAPCGWYFSSLGLVMDLVAKALADAIPDRVTAANYGDSENMLLMGPADRRGERFIDWQCHVGGWGGWSTADGESGLINHVNGSLRNFPIEAVESNVPVRILEYRLRQDSGGAGRHRGGCGIVRTYLVEEDGVRANIWFERSKTPGWGLFGGHDGTPPRVVRNPGTPEELDALKASQLPLERGDSLSCATGGGGGYGPPAERDPAAVLEDVADGFVSVEAARRLYGVEAPPPRQRRFR